MTVKNKTALTLTLILTLTFTSSLVMGRIVFEYREMLAIVSRVRKKEKEISLRYRRFFFSVFERSRISRIYFVFLLL
jgi:hypothetical protein